MMQRARPERGPGFFSIAPLALPSACTPRATQHNEHPLTPRGSRWQPLAGEAGERFCGKQRHKIFPRAQGVFSRLKRRQG